MDKKSSIGVFDSGLGGISVLRECVKELPQENFIYYGDSLNAPYGTKSTGEVKALSEKAFLTLLAQDVKAVVVACNTASSIAGDFLRQKYADMIIIEIEPALKPAVTQFPRGKIVVMATPITLREIKFTALMEAYGKTADIVKLPCPGLPEFVERGELNSAALRNYLADELSRAGGEKPEAIVLGCTHYPFVRRAIQEAAGNDTVIFDGSAGTARQLKNRLKATGLLNDVEGQGKVTWLNSDHSDKIARLAEKLFTLKL